MGEGHNGAHTSLPTMGEGGTLCATGLLSLPYNPGGYAQQASLSPITREEWGLFASQDPMKKGGLGLFASQDPMNKGGFSLFYPQDPKNKGGFSLF